MLFIYAYKSINKLFIKCVNSYYCALPNCYVVLERVKARLGEDKTAALVARGGWARG